MGGSGKKAPIQGRGNGSRLFVNGERIPDGKRIYFQTYLTEKAWMEMIARERSEQYSSPMSNWAVCGDFS